MRLIHALTLATLILFYAFLSAAMSGPARVAVKVEGGAFRFTPADLRVKVTVEPDEANRLLTVEADSGTFYRSTDEDLTGDSPRTRWVERWRDLPGGEYQVTATVRTSKGEAFKATDRVEIRDYTSGP